MMVDYVKQFQFVLFLRAERKRNRTMMARRDNRVEMMVPKRLKEARLAVGLSQEKLAELADIDAMNSRSQISSYESGRHTPPFSFVLRLARALDYPEYYFYAVDDVVAESLLQFHRNKNNPDFNPYITELFEIKKQLQEGQKAALSLADLLKNRTM
jgi:transcriptional regulator with XRE-family HTH domain